MHYVKCVRLFSFIVTISVVELCYTWLNAADVLVCHTCREG